MSEIDILAAVSVSILVAGLSFFLAFLLVKHGLRVPPQPIPVADKRLTMFEVILLMFEKLDPSTDQIRFVADDADWYKDPLFSSVLTLFAKDGARGTIRLRNPSDSAVNWYDTRGIRFGGRFFSSSDLKAMIIGEKTGMFVLRKNGRYYSVKTNDIELLRKLIDLYEIPSAESDSALEKEILRIL